MERFEGATAQQLQTALATMPAPVTSTNGHKPQTVSPRTEFSSRLLVADWLRDRGLRFTVREQSDRVVYALTECLFNPDHKSPDAGFIQFSSGAWSYNCFHTSCQGITNEQVRQRLGPPDRRHYDPPLPERQQSDHRRGTYTPPEPIRFDLLSAEQFSTGDYRQRFLIKRILVANQFCVFGGPKKSMKTSVALALWFSLATGVPFLNCFDVPAVVRSALMSGESGMFTLQETARRIAQAHGRLLSSANGFIGTTLPKLARSDHLDALATMIREYGLQVLMIDPAYLALLSGDTQGRQASNVFDMGSLLTGLIQVGQETGCTIILIHHNKKSLADPYAVPELEDLAFTGFSEAARQWILLNRREPYEVGTGNHRLWLNVGGSAGHSGTWALDISEGVPDDEFRGREWHVNIQTSGNAVAEAKAAAQRAKQDELRNRVLIAMQQFPEGETDRGIRDAASMSSSVYAPVRLAMHNDKIVEPCEVLKGGKTYSGWKLTGSQQPVPATILDPFAEAPK